LPAWSRADSHLCELSASDDLELETRPADKKLSEMTWITSKYFDKGDLEEAARRYRDILGEFPNDPVAKTMLAACSPSLIP